MRRSLGLLGLAGLGATAFALVPARPSAAGPLPPSPRLDEPRAPALRTAVLAGGCFWGTEAVFEHVRGVRRVVAGYAGGAASDANYEAVSANRTGHAEAIRITYDPAQVTYGELLRIFFSVAHDPTQVGRQGPDKGPSYRSAIFPQSEGQRRIAAAYMAQLGAARAYPKPLTTRLEGGRFFPAEATHQDFMRRNPRHRYILVHDVPKLAALRAGFPRFWRA